jgi:mucin-19
MTVTTVAPTIAKAFMPATISAGGTSTISFTLTNTNSVALTAANFTDTLTNMRVSGAQTVTGCSGSNMFTADQTGLLNFAGLTIPAAGNCTITLLVTSNTPGMLPNTTAGVASANAPTGAASNTANLTVNASAASIVKSFVTPTIALGATSQIDFTITNSNAIALTAAAFSDTLANMFIHATAAATGSCVGAGTNNFTINQTGLLNFTGLTIPASGACTVSIVVRSNTLGMHPNIATGVSSPDAPTGANSASVTLTVNAAPPTISKAFAANPIASGGVSTLTITITNPNAGPITVTSVTDTFPTMPSAGMVRASTPNASTTCASGMVTHALGSVTLTGGTVPANASCTFQIDVTAANAGAYVNTIGIGALTTNAGSNAAAATATLTVTAVANVSITKSAPATVPWGTTITYTSTVTNAGPDAADLTVFSDTVPAAITGVGAACALPTGGAVCGTVNVAGNSVTSTITTLPLGGSVTFTITGTAPQSGTLSNSATAIVPMGVSDPDDPTRIGAGNNTSAPAVTVVQSPDLRVAKTSPSMTLIVGVDTSFTLTPSNSGSLATSGVITVVDTLPAGLTYVALGSGGTGWTCLPSGQIITCTSSAVISAGGTGNLITINVQVLGNAAPSISNVAIISGGNEPTVNIGNNSAVLNLPVGNAAMNFFTTDGMQSGMPGASLLYTHTFNANISGSVSFNTTNVPSPFIGGWTVQLFRDTNCNAMLDGAEGATEITNTSFVVTAVQQLCIITKSNIPFNATFGATDLINVTATFTPVSGPVVTYTRIDITTVGSSLGSGLVLSKSVRNVTQGTPAGTSNMARPGNVLEYLITYTNTSNSPLSTIALSDATPAYTTFLSADCVTPLPNNISTCIASTVPTMGGMGLIAWTVTGSLIPMQVGTVRFRVTVQ